MLLECGLGWPVTASLQDDRSVGVAGGQARAVGREHDASKALRAGLDHGPGPAGAEVSEDDPCRPGSAEARVEESGEIATEKTSVSWPSRKARARSRSRSHSLDRAVLPGGGQDLPSRENRQPIDAVRMGLRVVFARRRGRRVPQLDHPVVGRRDQRPPVRGEEQVADVVGMAAERAPSAFPRRDVPEYDAQVVPRRCQRRPIGRESDRQDAILVFWFERRHELAWEGSQNRTDLSWPHDARILPSGENATV